MGEKIEVTSYYEFCWSCGVFLKQFMDVYNNLLVIKRNADLLFFGKVKTDLSKSSNVDSEDKESISKCLKLRRDRTKNCEINENFLHSGIWWCIKVVDGHQSNNFWSSLTVRLHYSFQWENRNAGSFCEVSVTIFICKCKCNYFNCDFVIFRTCCQVHFFVSIFIDCFRKFFSYLKILIRNISEYLGL